jgi:hypothetical protein
MDNKPLPARQNSLEKLSCQVIHIVKLRLKIIIYKGSK